MGLFLSEPAAFGWTLLERELEPATFGGEGRKARPTTFEGQILEGKGSPLNYKGELGNGLFGGSLAQGSGGGSVPYMAPKLPTENSLNYKVKLGPKAYMTPKSPSKNSLNYNVGNGAAQELPPTGHITFGEEGTKARSRVGGLTSESLSGGQGI